MTHDESDAKVKSEDTYGELNAVAFLISECKQNILVFR